MSEHFSSSKRNGVVGLHPSTYPIHCLISQWSFAPLEGIPHSPPQHSNYVADNTYDGFCDPAYLASLENLAQLCPMSEDMVLSTSDYAQCTSAPPQTSIPTVDTYSIFDPSNSFDNQHNPGPAKPSFYFQSYEDVARFETSPATLTMYDKYSNDSSYYPYVHPLDRGSVGLHYCGSFVIPSCSRCHLGRRCVVHSEKSDYPG